MKQIRSQYASIQSLGVDHENFVLKEAEEYCFTLRRQPFIHKSDFDSSSYLENKVLDFIRFHGWQNFCLRSIGPMVIHVVLEFYAN